MKEDVREPVSEAERLSSAQDITWNVWDFPHLRLERDPRPWLPDVLPGAADRSEDSLRSWAAAAQGGD